MMDDIAPQGAAGAEAPKRAIGAEIRSKLNHPVIDGDGHAVELSAALPDYLSQIVGPDQTREWTEKVGAPTVLQVPPGGWWLSPSGPIPIDRAMAMLPAMRKERNQAVGIDFSVVYTTLGLQMLNIKEDERRRAFSRALNMMNADVYGGFSDCMTVSAIVPVESPAEAIDELEFVTSELGMKTITINGYVAHQPTDDEPRRVIPLALDSLEDYDPFWQRCLDLGVSVACHGGSSGTDRHASRVNYTFNHISTFADHNEFFCRSLFFGGVPKRFPELNFAFLEGGVGWACNLYHNIYEHWERRNAGAMGEFLDPRTLDVELLAEMAETYATPSKAGSLRTPTCPMILPFAPSAAAKIFAISSPTASISAARQTTAWPPSLSTKNCSAKARASKPCSAPTSAIGMCRMPSACWARRTSWSMTILSAMKISAISPSPIRSACTAA